MTDEKNIRIGFFKDFDGEDSVLIDSDIQGLLEIEELFLKLSTKKQSINIEYLKFLDTNNFIKIILTSGEVNHGLKKHEDAFFWILTPEKWNNFKEMTTVLYKNKTGGHQYLDSDSNKSDDLQVVLSFNEYGLGFWDKFNSNN